MVQYLLLIVGYAVDHEDDKMVVVANASDGERIEFNSMVLHTVGLGSTARSFLFPVVTSSFSQEVDKSSNATWHYDDDTMMQP